MATVCIRGGGAAASAEWAAARESSSDETLTRRIAAGDQAAMRALFAGDAPDFVEVGEAGIAVMMLRGVSVVFNSLGDVLGLVSRKRSSENRQVLVGFQSTEAFGCLHHAGGGPAQRHRGISPSLHVATDAAHGPHHVLN